MEVIGLGALTTGTWPGESWTIERKAGPARGSSHGTPDGFRAVVDLGVNRALAVQAAAFRPNVVVLTHSDSDHIGGCEAFYDKFKAPSGFETWVPFDWLRLRRAAGALPADAKTLRGRRDVTEALADALAEDDVFLRTASRETADDGDAALAGDRSQVMEHGTEGRTVLVRDVAVRLAQALQHHAVRILALLESLAAVGSVRYFDVEGAASAEQPPWRVQGSPGRLSVVNAVEVDCSALPPSASAATAADFVREYRLTIQNERSLMVFAWHGMDGSGAPCCQGALLCGDGVEPVDAAGATQVPWEFVGVQTAVHHGSTLAAHNSLWTRRPPALLCFSATTGNAHGRTSSRSIHGCAPVPAVQRKASGRQATPSEPCFSPADGA